MANYVCHEKFLKKSVVRHRHRMKRTFDFEVAVDSLLAY